jgi:hypothetical protein
MRLVMISLILGASLTPGGAASNAIHTTFSLGTANGTYVGRAVFVEAGNGSVHGNCHGRLVLGDDVESTTSLSIFIATPYGLLSCDGELTPGGQVNLSCSN